MADCIAWDRDAVRQRAQALLSVADSVKIEGWSDGVAEQLQQAAHDLLVMATEASAIVAPPGSPGARCAPIMSPQSSIPG
jgi:hypothetical protein